jgi:LPXTG-motif cell wall-anchored protein
MKRQASLVTVLGASSALLVGLAQVGLAQGGPPPGMGGPPPGMGGPPPGFQGGPGGASGGAAGDAGAITNTTTTTSETATFDDGAFASDTQTLPNTGGAPLLMALAGGLTAAGAFCLRRKIS